MPNSVAPLAKAPMSLADHSGEVAFGNAMYQQGGRIYGDIIQTKIANEKAEFLGNVDKAPMEFSNWLEKNPNATEDQINAQKQTTMLAISQAGDKLTTPDAKNYATAWMAAKKEPLGIALDDHKNRVLSKQVNDRFEINRKYLIGKGDKPQLAELYKGQKLYDTDMTAKLQEMDFAKIDANNYANTVEGVRGQAQSIIDNSSDKTKGKKGAYDLIQTYKANGVIQPKEAGTLLNSMDSYAAGQEFAASSQYTNDIGELRKKVTQLNQQGNPTAGLELARKFDLSKYTGKNADDAGKVVQDIMDKQNALLNTGGKAKSKGAASDADALKTMTNALNGLRNGTTNEHDYKRLLADNAGKLNDNEYVEFEKRASANLKPADIKLVNSMVDNFAQKQYDLTHDEKGNPTKYKPIDSYQYRFAMEDWLAENPKASEREKYQKAAGLAAIYSMQKTESPAVEELTYLTGLKDTIVWGEDYKPEKGFTNTDVKKAQEITGGSAEITPDMEQQWSKYLSSKKPVPAGMVRVISSLGVKGYVKRTDLEAAKAEGYKEAE